ACVTLSQEVKEGQPLILFARDYPDRGAIASLVWWVRPIDSHWRVGIKFLTPLKDPLSNLTSAPVESFNQENMLPEEESIQKLEKNLERQPGEEKPAELTLFKAGFVHLLVHDLKGPLAAIQGVLETLAFELEGKGIKGGL